MLVNLLSDIQNKIKSSNHILESDSTILESVDNDIRKISKKIQHKIKECEKIVKNVDLGIAQSNSEKAIVVNIQKSYSIKLQQIIMRFRQIQSDYSKKLELINEDQTGKIESEFSEYQKNEIDLIQIETTNRKREIEKVAKSIREISSLFKDLSSLIIDQVFSEL